ncbi:MAG: DUF309 domain-containing protein [Actinobacteria bacterium]|nr:DUF309 domain-containing protein [Actinomycetota bacterium]MBO0835203.1 DUF309 domain-containing protein [Actinomycetota bacterium]
MRDRDPRGRARNARPRDALGRPLARGVAGEPPTSDQALPPAEALTEAQRLLDAERPFHAHEVLEAVWKAAPQADRDLWQGLAQLAVGLTHARRGNAHGAVTLLRRGARRLDSYPDDGPYGIDVAGLRDHCAQLAGQIESAGLAALDSAALRIRLRASPQQGRGG